MAITIQDVQRARDLKAEISELTAEDQGEVIFISPNQPGRRPETIYSMRDGEPITMPLYLAKQALQVKKEGGGFAFTSHKEQAPEYKLGDVKCFLHPESVERTSGLLEAAGIAAKTCASAHLASKYAMQEVAKSKHKKEWAAYQEYLREQREAGDRAERRTQTEAMLAMAGRSVGAKVCKNCGKPIEGKLADHGCE